MTESAESTAPDQSGPAVAGRNPEGEKQAGRSLDAATSEAIDLALKLAPEVADAPSAVEAERVIDVAFASVSEATFARKRVNAALSVHEWLGEIAVWVWQADTHKRAPLSQQGRERGFELRLEQASKSV
ncbi:MAG: hypothetical protein ACRBK7_15275 [Acidimicrobiales bacterium]